tara:strand:- start:164 stop:592 length:429 start_codon:yes stop_codon:yes gene_type:complete
MELQETKEIINFANDLGINKRELFDFVASEDENFEVDNYRFLTEDEALKECINMYQCDEYLLGCFNASFIEDYIPLDYDDIKILQEAEQYDIIGRLILNSGKLDEMIEEYIRLDGYGHALHSYDGNNSEITLNGIEYIYFRN